MKKRYKFCDFGDVKVMFPTNEFRVYIYREYLEYSYSYSIKTFQIQ